MKKMMIITLAVFSLIWILFACGRNMFESGSRITWQDDDTLRIYTVCSTRIENDVEAPEYKGGNYDLQIKAFTDFNQGTFFDYAKDKATQLIIETYPKISNEYTTSEIKRILSPLGGDYRFDCAKRDHYYITFWNYDYKNEKEVVTKKKQEYCRCWNLELKSRNIKKRIAN